MTVEEAVGLVLEAAVMASTGEVFVLDMGEPVLIVDLVRAYAALLHRNTDDVVIRFTGLRPGEKLDETLTSANEERTPTAHPKIWFSRANTELPVDFECSLQQLFAASSENNTEDVRRRLAALVPGYRPTLGDPAAAAAPYPDDW